MMITDVDFMGCSNLPRTDWVRKLGRIRQERITGTTRLLMVPLVHARHFSLLDLDLGRKTSQHHDSTNGHARNESWAKKAGELGEVILSRLANKSKKTPLSSPSNPDENYRHKSHVQTHA